MAAMNIVLVLRYAIYIVSGGAMGFGVATIFGYLVPTYFPEEYRVIFGAVVFLYGAHRFAVTYIRSKELRRDEK